MSDCNFKLDQTILVMICCCKTELVDYKTDIYYLMVYVRQESGYSLHGPSVSGYNQGEGWAYNHFETQLGKDLITSSLT